MLSEQLVADFSFCKKPPKGGKVLTSYFGKSGSPGDVKRKSGELYKIIKAHGKTFEIYYGYYEEVDRLNPLVEPMEMYPNFLEEPVYTDDGTPFATSIQPPCEHFKGEPDEDNTCYQCSYYEKCEELLGVCRCKARREAH